MLPVVDVIRSRTTPWMTITLITTNVVTFLYAWSLPAGEGYAWTHQLAFAPADPSFLSATTSLFVQQNGALVLLSAIVLWIFGDNVEDQLGHTGFVSLFILSGYAGWLAVLWAARGSADPAVALVGPGASIAGVLGAYFVMFPRSRVLVLVPARSILDTVELPAVLLAAAWFSLQLVGLARLDQASSVGLSLWPYVGGSAAGMVAVRFMRRPERRRVEWWGA